jgi:hypothetical protein
MATNPQSSAPPNSYFYNLETVISDEILEELYAFREAYAAQFDYDVKKMFADLATFGVNNPAPRASLQPVDPKQTLQTERKIGDGDTIENRQ